MLSTPIMQLEAKVAPDVRQKLQASAKQYEGVFLNQVFSEMFKNVDLDPMSQGSSAAEDTYKGMMTEQYSKAVTQNGPGIGLASSIYSSLLQSQIASQEKTK